MYIITIQCILHLYVEWKFCDREKPCENGGTCIDLPNDNYRCLCPICECSTVEPFDNCTIGMIVKRVQCTSKMHDFVKLFLWRSVNMCICCCIKLTLLN